MAKTIEDKTIDNIKSLVLDIMFGKDFNSYLPLEVIPTLYSLYTKYLDINPFHNDYYNRDRLIVSNAKLIPALYSTLYFANYPITIDNLKEFSENSNKIPITPEINKDLGIEMTTGYEGEGIGSGVGIALGEKYIKSILNDKKKDVIDFYTYVLCTSNDLMKGISYESTAIASHYNLNKLILLYIEDEEVEENITYRFNSINWNVISVTDGNNTEAISIAIEQAKSEKSKPTIIEIKVNKNKYKNIDFNSLKEEDVSSIKEELEVRDIPYTISQELLDDFRNKLNNRIKDNYENFIKNVDELDEEGKDFFELLNNNKNISFRNFEYELPTESKENPSTTVYKIINKLIDQRKNIISTNIELLNKDSNNERNIKILERTHASASISNGLALLGLKPITIAKLIQLDNEVVPLRLSSIMSLPIIYTFINDSISNGGSKVLEPVEQLTHLRSIPNINVYRPADVNEIIGTFKDISNNKTSPSAIVLSKNDLPILNCTNSNNVSRGGYIVKDFEDNIKGIILSSGEELHSALEVSKRLEDKGIYIRVVSIPNLNKFLSQDDEYIEEVIPVEYKKIVIETSPSMSWSSIVFNSKYLITQNTFGTSGTKDVVLKHFGFDIETLTNKVEELLK